MVWLVSVLLETDANPGEGRGIWELSFREMEILQGYSKTLWMSI